MSEHIAFSLSYFIASVMTIGLITWYSHSILKAQKLSTLIGGTLTLLYAFIYVIVHLEDYALLVGSFGLFVALAIVMHYARRIEWYDVAN
jgi:inner membrane protein